MYGGTCQESTRSDLDLAVDDLLLQLLQLRHDVVDVAARGGVVHAALGQVVDDRPALGRTVDVVLDEVVDRDVDLLHHGGQNPVAYGRVGGLGLVGVDPDGPGVRRLGRLEYAAAGAARGLVDDVGAGVVHA